MPCSNIGSIEDGIRLILKAAPDSVLDVGVGFGMWGFFVRQYLDIRREFRWKGVSSEDWQVRLDGVEVFQPYTRAPHLLALYDKIHSTSARDVFEKLDEIKPGGYDLVILSHVLEHMPKEDGDFVLKTALEKCGSVIVGLPLDSEEHSHVKLPFGNRHEGHVSWWNDDIKKLQEMAEVSFIEEDENLLAWIKGAKYVDKTPPGWVDRFRSRP